MKPAFLFSSTGLLCTCALLCASVGISMHPPAAVREERNHGSDYPREAALYRALSMRDERGVILPNGLIRAHEHVKRMKEAAAERRARNQNAADNPTPAPMTSTPTSATASSTAATAGASAQTLAWTWVGPGNIGGRVRALVMHPTNLGTMFAGSAGGGIWKTTDGGTTWAPVDDFLASLAVTSIVMQPGRPDTMYAATGEGFGNLDAIRGAGIFKSTDAGATWTQLPATANGAFWYVNRLAVSPDGKILLAATSGGAMRRSIDGGASFTQVLADAMADVKFHPTDSAKAIAGGVSGGVWVTSDGGASWTAAIGVPRSSGRCELAYARSNPLIVYASCAINGGWLYRSQDGGASFALAYFGPLQLLERQGWYANALWVNPTNAHDVLVGGGKLNHSTDGGASFTQVADINTQHPDLHAIVETPSVDGSTDRAVYIASDGGISRADDVNAITLFSSTGWHFATARCCIKAMSGRPRFHTSWTRRFTR
jgi:photosystem II stability/assembly factor-like uncharacterized protein